MVYRHSVAWDVETIGDVAQVSSGGTPNRNQPAYWGGSIPWVTTSAIDFCYITEAEEYITEAGLRNSSTNVVPKGTLLMAMYGQGVTRGKVALLGIDATTNQACASIVPGKRLKAKFLFYYLQSQYERIRNIGHGGNQKNLSGQLIKEILVPVPSLEEQSKLIEIMENWDRSIEQTQECITAKQLRRKALMQQLLTGKRRFPGFTKPWRTAHLGDVFSNRTESRRDELPLLSITGEGGIVSRKTVERRDTSNEDKGRYLRICPGDIGYNTMRMWQGVSGLSNLEGIVSPAYTIVVPDSSLNPEFMATFFKYPPTINLFRRYSQGLVDDTLNLKFRHFSEIRLTIPEKEEQTKIASVFRYIDKELQLLRLELDALKEQKKGLMQQLLTGKKRVRVTEVAA